MAVHLERSFSDDLDSLSVRTYDTSATAVSPSQSYFPSETHHSPVTAGQYHTKLRYITEPYLDVPSAYRKPPQQAAAAAHTLAKSRSHGRLSNTLFPMPVPRHASTGAIKHLSSHPPLPAHRQKDPNELLEAAWEDASCIDGGSPTLGYNEDDEDAAAEEMMAGGRADDRWEVEALRRQVEQLQMALSLQSQQRELEQLEAQNGLFSLRRRPSRVRRSYDNWSSTVPRPTPPPAAPLPPNPVHLRSSTMLNPTHSAAAVSMLRRAPPPTDAMLAPSAGLAALQQVAEEKRINDLNRKVEALEALVSAFTQTSVSVQEPSAVDAQRTSMASFSTAATASSSTPSTTPSGGKKASKPGNKLAAALGFGKAASHSSSSLDVSTKSLSADTDAGAGADVSRVSWSRGRKEKVAVPKAKVVRAAGRGRMVVKEK